MRFIFTFIMLSMMSIGMSRGSASAAECFALPISDMESGEFEACRIIVEADGYEEQALKRAPTFTADQCRDFCQNFTLVPVTFRGQPVVAEVDKRLVELFLQIYAQEETSIPSGTYLSRALTNLMAAQQESSDPVNEVILRTLQSAVRERDPSRILTDQYLRPFTADQLGPDDGDVNKGLKCSICQELIKDQLTKGEKVVQVNCGNANGGDVFCKTCITEYFQFNQNCPNCRGEIAPHPHED